MNGRVGKPWTASEDNLLIQAVSIHGETDNWKTVALSVPGRTNKACRKRWLHSLSPNVKKTAWTADEDQLLLSLYATHGTKWSVIARQIPGRTDDACSKRYREALDPSLKKDEWTSDEDARLLEAYGRLGGKWGQVGHELNRSGLACRNRWRMLERKKAAANREAAQGQPEPPQVISANVEHLLNPVQSSMSPWVPALPILDPGHFWDHHSSEYSPLLPGGLQPPHNTHDASFLSPHYSPSSNSSEPLQDEILSASATAPAPFQFASSSLSSALSISRPHESQSTLIEPPSSRQSPEPISFQHDDLFDRENHDVTPQVEDSPERDSSPEPMSIDPPEPVNNSPAPTELSPRNTPSEHLPQENPNDLTTPFTSPALPILNVSPIVEPAVRLRPIPDSSPISEQSTLPQLDIYRHYRSPNEKPGKATIRRRPDREGPPPRLSSKLPAASDPSILAYACGHEQCWPEDATTSSHCFSTSQQLSDHWKVDHLGDITGSKPFRCSLAGCGKGWKSINGLQYHLQISKAHFQQALSASFPGPRESGAPSDAEPSVNLEGKQKKIYRCPHDHCSNQYKQLSGLRYHLIHGHTHDMPAQLDVVPPALARKVAQKMQGTAAHSE